MIFHQPSNSGGAFAYNRFWYTNRRFRPHFHRNFEVIYVGQGSLHITVGQRQRTVQPGQFALVLPNEVHAFTPDEDTSYWVGVFSADFLQAFASSAEGKEGSDFVFACEESAKQFVRAHLMEVEHPYVYSMKACLYTLCDAYCSQIDLRPRQEKGGLLLAAVTDFIATHYREKISLQDLAAALGYNYHYLSKRINGIFRQSFSEVLNAYRLDKALTLLKTTDQEATEIALESGFQSVRSFNAYFKARTGMTPSQYRTGKK
jgi:AraC-like DNA-binding protein